VALTDPQDQCWSILLFFSSPRPEPNVFLLPVLPPMGLSGRPPFFFWGGGTTRLLSEASSTCFASASFPWYPFFFLRFLNCCTVFPASRGFVLFPGKPTLERNCFFGPAFPPVRPASWRSVGRGRGRVPDCRPLHCSGRIQTFGPFAGVGLDFFTAKFAPSMFDKPNVPFHGFYFFFGSRSPHFAGMRSFFFEPPHPWRLFFHSIEELIFFSAPETGSKAVSKFS